MNQEAARRLSPEEENHAIEVLVFLEPSKDYRLVAAQALGRALSIDTQSARLILEDLETRKLVESVTSARNRSEQSTDDSAFLLFHRWCHAERNE